MRDNYQYKNKLKQCSVLCVRDGSEAEGNWLFGSVSVTIIPVATEESELVASQEVLCTVCQRSFRRPGFPPSLLWPMKWTCVR